MTGEAFSHFVVWVFDLAQDHSKDCSELISTSLSAIRGMPALKVAFSAVVKWVVRRMGCGVWGGEAVLTVRSGL